jgi:hypothetical protein
LPEVLMLKSVLVFGIMMGALAAAQNGLSELPEGTLILAKVKKNYSSRNVKVGDQIVLIALRDVGDGQGHTVIPRNSKLFGHVTVAQRFRGSESPAQLAILIERAQVGKREVWLHAKVESLKLRPFTIVQPARPLMTGGGFEGMSGDRREAQKPASQEKRIEPRYPANPGEPGNIANRRNEPLSDGPFRLAHVRLEAPSGVGHKDILVSHTRDIDLTGDDAEIVLVHSRQ